MFFKASHCSTWPSSPASPNMSHKPQVQADSVATSLLPAQEGPSPCLEGRFAGIAAPCPASASLSSGFTDAPLNTKSDWLSRWQRNYTGLIENSACKIINLELKDVFKLRFFSKALANLGLKIQDMKMKSTLKIPIKGINSFWRKRK